MNSFYKGEEVYKRYVRDQVVMDIRTSRAFRLKLSPFYHTICFYYILTERCKQNGYGSTYRGYPSISG